MAIGPISQPTSDAETSNLALIAGLVAGGASLFLIGCLIFRCYKKKNEKTSIEKDPEYLPQKNSVELGLPRPASASQTAQTQSQTRSSRLPQALDPLSESTSSNLPSPSLPKPMGYDEKVSFAPIKTSYSLSESKEFHRPALPSSPSLLISESGEMKISIGIKYEDLEFDEKDKLGSGAYGTVYKGTYKLNEVAIKQLHAEHLSTGALEELKQEAGILGSMRSNYIVQLLGICLQPPNYCMVMELMPKGSLYSVLQNSPELPLLVRYRIGLDVCSGLFHLHEMNILHRDLKSLNVLLDDRFRAKITDFGLSKIKSEMGSMGSSKGMKGTLGWMAPELFAEKPQATTAADIYALGMVLWEMMVQPYRISFQDMAPASLITAKITRGEKQETIPESCPPEMAQFMQACWQEPGKRPSAKVLAKSLDALFKASQQKAPKVSAASGYDPLKSEVPGYGQNLMSMST